MDKKKNKQKKTGLKYIWYNIHIIPLPSGHMTFIQSRVNVNATLWNCIDVNASFYKRHVPAGTLNRSLENTKHHNSDVVYLLDQRFIQHTQDRKQ